MHRLIRIVALAAIALLTILWGAVWAVRTDPEMFAGTRLQFIAALLGEEGAAPTSPPGVSVGGPFSLVDGDGKAVSDSDFRGRWMLVYFGYTYCPDVCPTELQTISAALAKLGADAAKVAPMFITIDPARDTPAAIGSYVKLFDPKLIGLTGTAQQIADVAREYRVYYAKVTPKGASADGYLMDHSGFVYLMDPQGHFAALYNPATDADDMAAGLRDHFSQRS